eukprot:3672860-Amphidinium_carterae.1
MTTKDGLISLSGGGGARIAEWQLAHTGSTIGMLVFDENSAVMPGDTLVITSHDNTQTAARLTPNSRADVRTAKVLPSVCLQGNAKVRFETDGAQPDALTHIMATWVTFGNELAEERCGAQYDRQYNQVSYVGRQCSGHTNIDLSSPTDKAYVTDDPVVQLYDSNRRCDWTISSRRRYKVQLKHRYIDMERHPSTSTCYDLVK